MACFSSCIMGKWVGASEQRSASLGRNLGDGGSKTMM